MAYHGSGAHTPINYEEEEAGHRLQDVPSNVSFLAMKKIKNIHSDCFVSF